MSRPRAESEGSASTAGDEPRSALTYDDLPKEIKGVIKDYVAFTNAELRAAVREYFRDKAACERRHGKIGTWNVKYVTDMRALFYERCDFDEDIGAWDTSRVQDMSWLIYDCVAFSHDLSRWDVSSVRTARFAFRSGFPFEKRPAFDLSLYNY